MNSMSDDRQCDNEQSFELGLSWKLLTDAIHNCKRTTTKANIAVHARIVIPLIKMMTTMTVLRV